MTIDEIRAAYSFGKVISHPKRPNNTYKLTGYRDIKIEGVWVKYLDYICLQDAKKYARVEEDFSKFHLAIGSTCFR